MTHTVTKTITTERYEICSICGGRGLEFDLTGLSKTCRICNGKGQRLVERITTTESKSPRGR